MAEHLQQAQSLPADHLAMLRYRLLHLHPANRLLNMRVSGVSGSVDNSFITRFLAGDPIMAEQAFGAFPRDLEKLLREANRSQKWYGTHDLALGLGCLHWTDIEHRTYQSPVVLCPVGIRSKRNLVLENWFSSTGIVVWNPVLEGFVMQYFHQPLHACPSNAAEALQAFHHWLGERKSELAATGYQPNGLQKWEMDDSQWVLDNYAHRSGSLYRSFENLSPEILRRFRGKPVLPPVSVHDALQITTPVLPFDASQLRAAAYAAGEHSFLLQGPPGTGKSQTIVNIIATAVQQGKRVAVVSAKPAALQVIANRLDQAGLESIYLKINDAQQDRAAVYQKLQHNLDILKHNDVRYESGDKSRRLLQEVLNDVDKRNQAFRGDNGKLIALIEERRTLPIPFPCRVSGTFLLGWDDFAAATPVMNELLDVLAFSGNTEVNFDHAVFQLNPLVVRQGRDMGVMLEQCLAQQHLVESFPDAEKSLLLSQLGVWLDWQDVAIKLTSMGYSEMADPAHPKAVKLLRAQARLTKLEREGESASLMGLPLVGEYELQVLQEFLSNKPKPWNLRQNRARARCVKKMLGDVFYQQIRSDNGNLFRLLQKKSRWNDAYLRAKYRMEELCDTQSPHALVALVMECQHKHAQIPDSFRTTTAHYSADQLQALRVFRNNCHFLLRDAGERTLHDVTGLLAELHRHWSDLVIAGPLLEQLYGQHQQVYRYVAGKKSGFTQLKAALMDAEILRRIGTAGNHAGISGNTIAALAATADHWKQQVCSQNRNNLLGKQSDQLNRALHLVSVSSGSVKPALREQRKLLVRGLRTLRKESALSRHNRSLRNTFCDEGMPELLHLLSPVIIASPSALEDAFDGAYPFDLVVVDEAGIVLLEEALPALSRANQWVICGDRMQMAPSRFFSRVQRDELPESLLEMAIGALPECALGWHYRSLHPALFAYANHAFYNQQLFQFPAHASVRQFPVSIDHVPNGRFADGVNRTEALAVARLIRDYVLDDRKSLLVITMSVAQQEAVEEELRAVVADDPVFGLMIHDLWYHPDGVVLRTLEQVQGEERDHVIFALGYAPNESGRFRAHFGLLIREGGERRLNVAITRSRLSLRVVTSFEPGSIPVSGNPGLEHLRRFLFSVTVARQESENPEQHVVTDEMLHSGMEPLDFLTVMLPGIARRQIRPTVRLIGDNLKP
jgi:hypothetical protein